jgi:hypothetical protein
MEEAKSIMTKREAAIVSAYTGYLIGTMDELHKYIEQIMEKPIYTHELVSEELEKLIHEKSFDDFIHLEVTD